MILAHQDAEHFKKLIEAIDYKSDIYVHIDKKADINEFKSGITSPNVFFLKERTSISWAGMSMIDAEMKLLQAVLKHAERYTHAVLLSGTCYPIKHPEDIYHYFASQPHEDFIKFFDTRESPNHYMRQTSQKWFMQPLFNHRNTLSRKTDSAIRILLNKCALKNHWNKEIVPYLGSQWCALTMNTCRYVYTYHTENEWYREMNKRTFGPDAHYIHTIIGNATWVDMDKHLIPYKGKGVYRTANYHIIHQSLAKWYTLDDWQDIVISDKLFVRKVRSKDGTPLVHRINEEILKLPLPNDK